MTERYCSVCSLQITDADDPDRVGYHPGRCNDDTGRMSSMGPVPDQAFYGAVLELVREAEEVRTVMTATLSSYEAMESVQAVPEAIRAPAFDSPVLLGQVPGRVCARCGKPSERMYCSGACKVAAHRAKP